MSVDSPEPRQRTVAELLAENGGQQSGRRRRRRETVDDEGPVAGGGPEVDGRSAPPPPPAPRGAGAPPSYRPEPVDGPANGYGGPPQFADPYQGGDRNGHGGYGPPSSGYDDGYGEHPAPGGHGPAEGNGYAANGYGANGYGANGYGANGYAPAPDRAPAGPPPSPPHGWNAPPQPPPGRAPWGAPAVPEAPTGAFGARPPYQGPNGAAPGFAAPPPDTDGGPPTQLGAPPLDDADDIDDRAWTGEYVDDPEPVAATAPHRGRTVAAPAADGPPTQAGFGPDELDRLDDEYPDHGDSTVAVADDPEEHRRPRRARRAAVADAEDGQDPPDDLGRPEDRAAGTGQAWAMVIAQWIGGAIVGAGVWVGFRYLWTYFEIVALALSVVATVGLVVGVRALLRNDDLRTTMFAVLVGLLLTVSPALLVLLDR